MGVETTLRVQPRCHTRHDRRYSTQLQPAILRGCNWTSNSAAGVRARCSKTGFCMQFTALIGQPKERAMKRQSRRALCAAGLITAALASGAFAQQQEETPTIKGRGKL